MAKVLYGMGLRLMECLLLRVKVLDFAQRQIIVRDGKGMNERGAPCHQSRNGGTPALGHVFYGNALTRAG
jgi:site-specific recombinase XerD